MKTIWAKGKQEKMNVNLAFAKKLNIENQNTNIEIVAANIYRFFIDGEIIGYGPARAGHGYTRKDQYNLDHYIGKQVSVVIEVFGANVNSYYLVDEKPFFGCQVICGNNIIASTDKNDFTCYELTDRISKIQRYSFQRPFAEAYHMQKCRTNFYKGDYSIFPQIETECVPCNQLLDRNVSYLTFEEVHKKDKIETGSIRLNENKNVWKDRSIYDISNQLKGYPVNEIEELISDQVSKFEYYADSNMDHSNIISENKYYLYDFGRALTGFFKLSLKVNQKTVVYIIWDELITSQYEHSKNVCFYRNGCCNVIKYTLNAGDYRLLAFEPATMRYAKIIVTEGKAVIQDFSMVLYQNEDAYKLQFESTDEKLNRIVRAAQNTLAQNAVDILTDCPSRERAGWLCDTYFSGRSEQLMTGGNKVEHNFLENYCLAPQQEHLPDGMIPMCYPADHNDGVFIPNWSMWYVIELETYLERTGDIDLILNSKPKVYGIIEYFEQYINADGLLEDLDSWKFIEWSMCNDDEFVRGVNYPTNILYSKMLIAAGTLYNDEQLIKQGKAIKKIIFEQSFNGEFFEDNRIRLNGKLISVGHITETCQYYAMYFNIATKENAPKLYDVMFQQFGPKRDDKTIYPTVYKSNAFIGNYLRLEILLREGKNEQVIDECKDFFDYMAQRTSTLWENCTDGASLNHGFASVAANYIIQCETGYCGIDNRTKKVTLSKPGVNCNVSVTIPFNDTFIKIDIKNNERKVIIPNGYSVRLIE